MAADPRSATTPDPSYNPRFDGVSPELEGVDVVVLLPTLNEGEGLARTLDEIPFDAIRAAGWTAAPLVVDGGSTDATRAVARSRGVPILLQEGRGKGAAIRQGLELLHRSHVRFAVVMDADFTYPGASVAPAVALLGAGAHLVVGVRNPVSSPLGDARTLVHRVGNGLLNFTANQFGGQPIMDVCSGFWGVDVAGAHGLQLASDGFEIEAELFLKSSRAGFTVVQIPVPYRERVGVAKLNAVRDGARILLSILQWGRHEVPYVAPTPPPSLEREILALAYVHGASRLVVYAAADRRAEAEALLQRFRASNLNVRLVLREPGAAGWESAGVSPRSRSGSVVLELPESSSPAGVDAPRAVVHLPRTGRIVEVFDSELADEPNERPVSRSGAFVLEFGSDRPGHLQPVRRLVAQVFPSALGKELAMLTANHRSVPFSIWRSTASPVAGVPLLSRSSPDPRSLGVGVSPGDESSRAGPLERQGYA